MSPDVSDVGDLVSGEGEHGLLPSLLQEGQSGFDWDSAGTKFSYKEDVTGETEKTVKQIEASLELCATRMGFVQPPPVTSQQWVVDFGGFIGRCHTVYRTADPTSHLRISGQRRGECVSPSLTR